MSSNNSIIDENSSLKDRLPTQTETKISKDELIDSLKLELLSRPETEHPLESKKKQQPEMTPRLSRRLNILDELKNVQEDFHLTISRLRTEILDSEDELTTQAPNEWRQPEVTNQFINDSNGSDISLDETLNQLNDKEVFIDQLKEDLLQQQENSRSSFTELQSLTIRLKEKETEIINIRKGLASWINKVKQQQGLLKTQDTEIILLKNQLSSLERQIIILKEKPQKEASTQEKAEKTVTKKSPYEVLSISPGCSFDEVKKAYRSVSKKYNPHIVESLGDDVKELVTETCKEINFAFAWFKKEFGVS
jgi:DnaJ-domain-containing protein 1